LRGGKAARRQDAGACAWLMVNPKSGSRVVPCEDDQPARGGADEGSGESTLVAVTKILHGRQKGFSGKAASWGYVGVSLNP